jgi:hypothetical protein
MRSQLPQAERSESTSRNTGLFHFFPVCLITLMIISLCGSLKQGAEDMTSVPWSSKFVQNNRRTPSWLRTDTEFECVALSYTGIIYHGLIYFGILGFVWRFSIPLLLQRCGAAYLEDVFSDMI